MPVSEYFTSHNSIVPNSEQLFYEDMIVESIRIMGQNLYYLPREDFDESDFLLGENTLSRFDKAYLIEMYPMNVAGYGGDGEFFSKFGLEIRNGASFVVSRRSFKQYVPNDVALRPREGDLLYSANQHKLFEIKFVERDDMFYSLGRMAPYVYEMKVEQFRASSERINTGIDVIDSISTNTEIKIPGLTDNIEVQDKANTFVDITEISPFGYG